MTEKPLANVVLCCTSVTQDDRSSIIRQAIELGAVSQADLTSDVTHLIVARIQTEKYKYAARHRTDLKLMRVEWVPAIHQIWMAGQDVDLRLSEEKYQLPIFYGLRICVTNLDHEARSDIERLVIRHGGSYTGDLTKENTHLIAGSASGKKWEAVNSWQADIHIVGLEWLYESIKRGASLDEKYFKLELEASHRGQASWYPPKNQSKIIENGKQDADEKRKWTQGQQGSRKRLMKKSSALFADGLWTEILVSDQGAPQIDLPNPLDDTVSSLPAIQLDVPSIQADFSTELTGACTTNLLPPDISCGIFRQLTFYIGGFAEREEEILKKTLLAHGGTLTDREIDGAMYIVPQNGMPPVRQAKSTLVTEYWLERCLTLHALEDTQAHFVSVPFTTSMPIPRMSQISICISGFTGIDLVHIEKLSRMAGALFYDTLTKDRSILLASSRECRKYSQAKQQGTRVVRVEWLWECIRRGKMIGITEYAMDGIEGSACKIDGGVVKDQRRSKLLCNATCFVTHQHVLEYGKLNNLIQSMGGQVANARTDEDITHIIGHEQPSDTSSRPGIFQVSSDWLHDTFRTATLQPETNYPSVPSPNKENVPPVVDASRSKIDPQAQIKLANELKELRNRLNSAPPRRASRKILGRAATLPYLAGDDPSVMIVTNENDTVATEDTSNMQVSQGVTYSDPDAAEERRRVLAKLAGITPDEEPQQLPVLVAGRTGERTSMRATGLGDSRRLRR